MLQAVAEEVLHGNTPVDGVHENIKLIHSTERGLCPLTKSKCKGHCGIALLSTCSPCAAADDGDNSDNLNTNAFACTCKLSFTATFSFSCHFIKRCHLAV